MPDLVRVNRCQFCKKTFTRKNWFQKHTCPKKKKFEEAHNVVVLKGYRLFLYWMKIQNMIKRGKEPDVEKFLDSPLKSTFVRLAEFVQEQNIISPYSYLDWLIANKIPAPKWCEDDPARLDQFKEFINLDEDPIDQAEWTLNKIKLWVLEKEERTVQEFFDKLTPTKILSLTHQRVIKPWVLFGYGPVMMKWLDDDTYNPEIFHRINDLVNCSYWVDKVSEDDDSRDKVHEIMERVWLISQT